MAHFLGIFHGNCALRYVGGVLEIKKLDFRGLKGQFDVKMANFRGLIAKIGHLRPILTDYKNHLMTHFLGICHGNCALRYFEGVLEVKKFDFRGLKGQFNAKKANYRGLIAKIGHCRLILASRTHL